MNHSIQCRGFQASGVAAGIKKTGMLDLGLIYTSEPASLAGVFTRNQVQAAPVILSKQRLAAGRARAVVVNAGNANCCAGPEGLAHARRMTDDAAEALKLSAHEVLVASTGVIGAPLPIRVVQQAIPGLVDSLRPDGFGDFARAIMTTDTVPKLVTRQAEIDGQPFSILAVAKGAGMIRPDMATMLCFICTDVGIGADLLQACLRGSVDRTLNRITIDGDTSTNDTVLAMANGMSGAQVKSAAQRQVFQELLDAVLMDIAHRLVKDGEGVTKLVEIKVQGAASEPAALCIAETVAHSPLVKTAFFGQDANWGRIMAAVGRAGVVIDPEGIDIYFDQVQMVRYGQGCGREAEKAVSAVLQQDEFRVTIDLHQGQSTASMLTCDFSVDYVKINADYRS